MDTAAISMLELYLLVRDIRLAHYEVITCVDRWYQTERADECSSAIPVFDLTSGSMAPFPADELTR